MRITPGHLTSDQMLFLLTELDRHLSSVVHRGPPSWSWSVARPWQSDGRTVGQWTLMGHRNLVGSDGCEELPVGFPGV